MVRIPRGASSPILQWLHTQGQKAPTVRERQRWAASLREPLLANTSQREVMSDLDRGHDVVVTGTRRSGKTELFRWILAKCISRDDFIVKVLTNTLEAPTENWMDREAAGSPSALDLLRRCGAFAAGTRVIRHSALIIKEIQFPWGSRISVLDVETARAVDRKRGTRAHLFWVDEAQAIRGLEQVFARLVQPMRTDFGAQILMTGTPAESENSLLQRSMHDGYYRVHWLSAWKNPFLGEDFTDRWGKICRRTIERAQSLYGISSTAMDRITTLSEAQLDAIQQREYLTPGDAAFVEGDRDNGGGGLSLVFRREILGQWVSGGGKYVFVWRDRPPVRKYWCSESLLANEHYEISLPVYPSIQERMEKLPRLPSGQLHSWRYVLGVDLGYVHPSAFVLVAWTPTLRQVFEVWSNSIAGLSDPEVFDRMMWAVTSIPTSYMTFVADLNGMRLGTRAGWNRELFARLPTATPIEIPDKARKNQQIIALNLDFASDRFQAIAGSPLDIALTHLAYRDGKIDKERVVTDLYGRSHAPGDHGPDALRYAMAYTGAIYAPVPMEQTSKEWRVPHPERMA